VEKIVNNIYYNIMDQFLDKFIEYVVGVSPPRIIAVVPVLNALDAPVILR
jgi:hypothetical protein